MRIPRSVLTGTHVAGSFLSLGPEGISLSNAYGTAVLVIAVLLVNMSAYLVMNRIVVRRNERR